MNVGSYPVGAVGRRSGDGRVTVGVGARARRSSLPPPIDSTEVVNSIYQSGVGLVNSTAFPGLWGMDIFVRDMSARVQSVGSPFARGFLVVFLLAGAAFVSLALFVFNAVIATPVERPYGEA
eukprot:77431-Hanusia_phi.AAC.4